jgi:cellulose synthase/poly-beta-1,6-N-acetylglucosamine synthase-like glycosyltransferase
MNLAVIVITLIIAGLYSVMILLFATAFMFRKDDNPDSEFDSDFVSVIVAFRNEAHNLESLLNSLLSQNYKAGYEIILVDDHSDDDFEKVLSQFTDERIKVYSLPQSMEGKKQALRYAVSKTQAKVLLFTDADCSMSQNWMTIMISQLNSQELKMLCGPVEFEKNKGLFSGIFMLEFMSLTGSGASGFFIDKPFMCNGANYAVTREVFNEAAKFFNDKYSSGDDVFLLHYISKKYKASFCKNTQAIVKTSAPDNMQSFFNQRIRWASKTTGYRDLFSVFTASITFLMSVLLVCLLAFSISDVEYLGLFLFALFAKTIVDLVFMIPVTRFYKKIYLLIWLPLLQLFYPLYVGITAIMSLFYKPYWKGRRIK